MIDSRRMRWTGQLERMGQKRYAYSVMVEIHERRTCCEDVDGRIILKFILEKYDIELE
jgi:hypothetical protein